MEFWTVPREWPGETAFLLGGGPSLRGFDAEILRGRRVIAINNAFLLAPWADVLYFCDAGWWDAHRVEVWDTFTGRYVVSLGLSEPGVKRLIHSGRRGLDQSPDSLKGNNSGAQAINLAYHFGASRIVLLGYDMHVNGAQTHWHSGHLNETEESQEQALARFLPKFRYLVEPLKDAGVEVLNATPGSALTCWPVCSLAEILK